MIDMTMERQRVKYNALNAVLTRKQMRIVKSLGARTLKVKPFADELDLNIMAVNNMLVKLINLGYVHRFKRGKASRLSALYEYSLTNETLEALGGEV